MMVRMVAEVTLLTRESCGSCTRVYAQIVPVCAEFGLAVTVVDVDAVAAAGDPGPRAEFGDRLPVVLVDGEEFACWEVDDEDLRAELRG